jgi:hypothetical protein
MSSLGCSAQAIPWFYNVVVNVVEDIVTRFAGTVNHQFRGRADAVDQAEAADSRSRMR